MRDHFLNIDSEQLEAALRVAITESPASVRRKPDRAPTIGGGQLGTVRKRGKSWHLQYRGARDATGRRRQPSVRIGSIAEMTRDQARAVASSMLEERISRAVPPGASCAWEAWVERYLQVYVRNLRRSSQDSVRSVIRIHLRSAFAGLWLHEIRLARIQNWIARQQIRGAAPSTIAARYAVLRRMLRRARLEGLAVEVPAGPDVDLPRSDAIDSGARSRAFTTDELHRILATAVEPWKTLFMFCTFSGLRISEALGLRWCDVNLESARLRVTRQAVSGRETAPKTAASVAERRIPSALLEHLRAFKADCAVRAASDALLFPSPRNGGPYHASGVRRHHLAPILQELGIRGRSFHGFRHWLGSSSMRAGVPLPVLQRMLRHKDRRSTEVYLEITNDDLDAAIEGAESRYLQIAGDVLAGGVRRNALEHEKPQ